MANNFTEKAEKALNCAVKIAEGFGHTYIGTEHMLRALIDDNLSCSFALLSKCGVSKEKIEAAIKDYSGTGTKSRLSAKDMTPRCRKIIEGAYRNSIKYSSVKIGTEHLLLALTEEKDSVAVKILDFIGIDILTLKDEIITFLRSTDRSSASSKKGQGGLQFLNQYGKNLNNLAKNGEIDPVVSREEETQRLIRILSRRTKNNPCLIGEAGVGKTAIVEGLAQKIVEGNVPELLKDKVIYSVDLTSMVAGAKYRGDFEERIKSIISEAASNSFVILFIDEIHTIVGAGAAEGAIDAANILKPELSRNNIQLIGATTLAEYHKYIEKDPALERRFQPLMIEETTETSTIEILRRLKDRYEKHHSVIISDEAIVAAVRLSERYIQDRRLPDKALDILDEACAKANVSNKRSHKHNDEEKRNYQVLSDLEAAIQNGDFEKASAIHNIEAIYKNKKNNEKLKVEISENDIKEIVTEVTGIPISMVFAEEKLDNLESRLSERVIGQKNAVKLLSNAVLRSKMGINNPQRPKGVFLFLGESGVGKTELAKALSENLFSTQKALIRFDMSEFGEKHSISKLIGSPPGYVGYEEGGVLTERIRRHPYSVVLFDEIEKASFEVLNLLLQIMDDGVLTDSLGRTVSFKNAFIILTSNIGAEGFNKNSAGFLDYQNSRVKMESKIIEKLKEHFRPEFINRIDEIVPFVKLTTGDLKLIAQKALDKLALRLMTLKVQLIWDESVCLYVAEKCNNTGFGARPVNRIITSEIENEISAILLKNSNEILTIKITNTDGKLYFECIKKSPLVPISNE